VILVSLNKTWPMVLRETYPAKRETLAKFYTCYSWPVRPSEEAALGSYADVPGGGPRARARGTAGSPSSLAPDRLRRNTVKGMGAPDRNALPSAAAGPVANTVRPHQHRVAVIEL
jgi:hypothetical protein